MLAQRRQIGAVELRERRTMQSYHFVINKQHRLGPNDRPGDLVEPDIVFAPAVEGEKRFLRKAAAWHLEKLFKRAEEQRLHLAAVSGYRSYQRQEEIYANSLAVKGRVHTERYIAPPGGSEHQTGLAMDLSCDKIHYELEEEFEQTPEGIWLKKNAFLFGFIIRYPRGKEEITGYAYEPWHIRYVTRALAYYLTKMQLTLEEYTALVSVYGKK